MNSPFDIEQYLIKAELDRLAVEAELADKKQDWPDFTYRWMYHILASAYEKRTGIELRPTE